MEKTLKSFIKELEAIKDELKDTPIKVVAGNGLEFEPKIRFLTKDHSFDITKENVKSIIISWE